MVKVNFPLSKGVNIEAFEQWLDKYGSQLDGSMLRDLEEIYYNIDKELQGHEEHLESIDDNSEELEARIVELEDEVSKLQNQVVELEEENKVTKEKNNKMQEFIFKKYHKCNSKHDTLYEEIIDKWNEIFE